MFIFEFCISKYYLWTSSFPVIVIQLNWHPKIISSQGIINDIFFLIYLLMNLYTFKLDRIVFHSTQLNNDFFLWLVSYSQWKKKSLSCSFYPKSKFGTNFKLKQMGPWLLARKESMMPWRWWNNAQSIASRWCHLYPSDSCPDSLPPTCSKDGELDTGSGLVGEGLVAPAQGLSQKWRRGLVPLVPVDNFLSVKQLRGSPRQI